ncbi:MAG: tRNA uracil 4-sulfurtransferase ThiI [Methanobacteriota archaeon]
MLYLLRYDEIALKSEPVRRGWENVLIKNIKRALECKVKKERGRIWVEAGEEAPEKLKKIFGIHSFSPCVCCGLEDLEKFFLEFAEKSLEGKKSFALRVRRTGRHDFTSQDVARKLGAKIQKKIPIKVELKNPEGEIFIEIRDNDCYIFEEVVEGLGGLPSGVEGKVVALISGGIDSPVAAWLMMKRGCDVVALYLDIFPFAGEEAFNRVASVVEVLKEYQTDIKLRQVNHGKFLMKVRKDLKEEGLFNYSCVACKREMYRIAEKIAREENAKGIATGECLGQVASQTLDNLFVISQACSVPIYRPLISFDKVEVISLAKKIGTYEKSIVPVGGCSAAPKKPATKAKIEKVLEFEEKYLGAT